MTVPVVVLLLSLLAAAILGALVATLAVRSAYSARLAVAQTRAEEVQHQLSRRLLAEERDHTERASTLEALAPLREALVRVERHVGVLERDRVEQFGELGERLAEVNASTASLRAQTATLAGSLNASAVRGTWGETQLRRVIEHAGLLPRCDFDEQVAGLTAHDARVRPDVVVRLPGEKVLVIDAKAPLSAFLSAQADGLDDRERRRRLAAHGAALRGHVDALAKKEYWSAFSTTPQMVVCFVPGDAILAAGLNGDPALYDDALARRIVLASPATLMALLRTVAFTWQQDALATNARELLALGRELYTRLGTLGDHVSKMGGSLRRSVEQYNALVGTLESRVLVTARRMHDLDLAAEPPPALPGLDATPRVLTAAELLDGLTDSAAERDDAQLQAEATLAHPAPGSATQRRHDVDPGRRDRSA